MKKKFVTLLMLLCFTITLAGCGTTESTESGLEETALDSTESSLEETTLDSTESSSEETEQETSHSTKTVTLINNDFYEVFPDFPDPVRNDTTGKWRISKITEDIDITEYAIDYYNKFFLFDDEIHAIINFTLNTTTKISVLSDGVLGVTIYEYVDNEEHDAKNLFSGKPLNEYWVSLNKGNVRSINSTSNTENSEQDYTQLIEPESPAESTNKSSNEKTEEQNNVYAQLIESEATPDGQNVTKSAENATPEQSSSTPSDTTVATTTDSQPAATVTNSQPSTAATVTNSQPSTTTVENSSDNTNSGGDSNFNTHNNPEQQNTDMSWVLNTNSKKIHYPSCKSVPKIAPHNYSTSNESLDILKSQGFDTCGNCFK